MTAIVVNDTDGLSTHANDLSAQPGSTSVADNVAFTREGRPERRNGFKDYSTNLPDFSPSQLLASAKGDQAYLHLDSGLWYNSAGTWYRKRGNFGSKFGNPADIWIDTSANVAYLTDRAKHVVSAVNLSTGVRTFLAGRPGSSGTSDGVGDAARFSNPTGIWGDGAGNLYVCDASNFTIRKIVISTQTVSTLAGTAGAVGTGDGTGAAARFTAVGPMWGDGAGTLYVGDGSAIRTVTYPSGVVTTFAGSITVAGSTDATGTLARFGNPCGLWGTASNGTLYVADFDKHTVRAVTLPGAVVTTFAGAAATPNSTDGTGTGARFNGPFGITGDGSGVLYVTESTACRVRKVTYPGAVVTSPYGTYTTTGSTDAVGTSALLNDPRGLAFADSKASLYVCDYQNKLIRKIYIGTGYVTTIAGIAAVAMASQPSNALYADGIIVGPD